MDLDKDFLLCFFALLKSPDLKQPSSRGREAVGDDGSNINKLFDSEPETLRRRATGGEDTVN